MAVYSYPSRTPEAGVKDIYLKVAIGAAGAVGTVTRRQGFGAAYPANAASLAAIVRNSAGNYTLNLDQRWQDIMEFDVQPIVASPATTDGIGYYIVSASLNQAQPTVVFQMVQVSGAAADPTSGAVLIIHVALKDSTV